MSKYKSSIPLPTFAAMLLLVLTFGTATSWAEDIRTRTIRVVPSKAWKADQNATITVLPGTNNSDHAKSDLFTEHMQVWMMKALDKLEYKTAKEGGDITYSFTIDVYDPGNAALRFGVGFGVGKGYARGTLTIKKKGRVVGEYRFSARLRGAGTKGLAKEVGPALVLQVHNGDADTELHEYKKEKKEKEKKEGTGG